MLRGLLVIQVVAAGLLTCWIWKSAAAHDDFPKIVDTQNRKDVPPTPKEAVKLITVPKGFRVTLFAGEPDVRQPIAMSFDDRGRLWVAECYTYAGDRPGVRWTPDQRDRILIFEDADNDGQFDQRKVFWNRGRQLSGIALGFGGVWALCAPYLYFIPDKNGDDVPDGEPEIILDGWAVKGVGHNIVNGLTWGPDGWLYGRHGIMDTSFVGPPGATSAQRKRLNCAIWRYHPRWKKFEVVTHGTTNPWGLDYDDHGQMFFTNNVIGHLWHVIPGAHYKRMYGEDLNPYVYGLIDQHADHYHWDTGQKWTDSRSAQGKHGQLGGGHSHCGGMIYLGDNWPARYRNTIFMCNTHGRRVNNDVPVRSGSGYVIRHNPDFLFANNAWFRGVDLKYGPDGGVYISDWTDLGECHDHDGVHRSSGRIYKVTFGKAAKPAIRDVSRLSDAELVQLQLHKNDWYVRHARRLLQERAAAGKLEPAIRQSLFAMFDEHKDVTRKLRALWCLYVTESLSPEWLQKQLRHPDEHVRLWAVRLLVDGDKVPRRAIEMFVDLARTDSSKLVRLFLASALQRLPIEERFALAAVLVAKREDADDHNLPLMIWYGIEPLVAKDSKAAVGLFTKCRMPLVRRYIARRLSETLADSTKALDELLSAAAGFPEPAQVDLLEGMDEALQGWRKAEPPKNWEALRARLETSSNPKVQKLVRSLSVVFGDGRALNELIELVNRQSADADARREALRILIQNRPKGLREILLRNLSDRALVGVAVQGLAAYDDPAVPKQILQHYRYLRKEDRPGAISTLVSRPHYAEALLKAVADGRIDRTDISAFHARQIQRFNRKSLNDLLTKVWGELRSTSAEKKKLIARYRDLLNQEALAKADRSHGRLVFKKVCAVCHTLYGEGNTIGPDLTGSNRDNLDYLLENIVDPSASVAADFKMSFVLLKSGRALSGVIGRKTDRILELQTQNEKLVIPLAEIDEIQPTPASLMPEGLFASLKEDEIRDLIAYLMSKRQVPLPEASRQD